MSTDWNQDSLEFVLDHIREAPEKQIQTAEALGVCPIFVVDWTQGKECGLQWEGLD